MSFGELIPQVFYDGIARFVAGLTIMGTCALVWWPELMAVRQIVGQGLSDASLVTALAFLVAAYVLALLLEGLWHLGTALLGVGRKTLPETSEPNEEQSRRSVKPSPEEKVWGRSVGQFDGIFDRAKGFPKRPSVAFAIDAVRLMNADVGARIVKLRAEKTLCRSLWIGWGVIALVYVISFCSAALQSGTSAHGWAKATATFLCLLLACAAIRRRQTTLGDRHLTALFNHWLLLVNPGVEELKERRSGKAS